MGKKPKSKHIVVLQALKKIKKRRRKLNKRLTSRRIGNTDG